jgi:hypothetical protein
MTYTILPNSGQSLGVTRVPINTNFSLIQTVFDNNHVDFNVAGAGKHKFLQMPVQSVAPPTIANEGAFYSKTQTADSQAFWRFSNSGTELQITNNTISPFTNPGAIPLMSGFTLQWGNGSFANGQDVFFFQTFTAVINIQITIQDNVTSANAFARTFDQSKFEFGTNAGAPVQVFWMAFGAL